MRRLIVNADDFGLTSGVNRGIAEAHEQGIVGSATLMACGKAFAGAAELARSSASMAVGCHIVLLDGVSEMPASEIASLLPGGEFRRDVLSFGLAAITRRIEPDHIQEEATAQIRKLQSAGIEVTHVDTHKHSHIFPQVLAPIVRACQACGVKKIRNPFLPARFNEGSGEPQLWKRLAQMKVLQRFRDSFARTVSEAGMLTTEGSVGVVATGCLNQKYFEKIIRALPQGSWEFVCHPGYMDGDLSAVNTRLRESREVELRVLTSPESLDLLRATGIDLVSYRQLT